ncbi:hypothetical protein [Halovivax cerinus]|uniref:Uncharacterized protein n=1 Tax=Halovivax cerinus TaxID=1487865 RepID=A0ABD5NKE8_9EURY|nr:hypothetical protein [Halovivax cerinus]
MTRYTPDDHKSRAQPAYRQDAKSIASLPPSVQRRTTQRRNIPRRNTQRRTTQRWSAPRRSTPRRSTPRQPASRFDPLPVPPIHAATPGSSGESLRVDVERPIDPNRIGVVPRERYPPCPHCDEPVITIRTLGPHLHTADPCGCPLAADVVATMLGGANR